MARLLKGDMLLGKVLVGITQTASGVDVRCRDGTVLRAKHVVCSLPFSTARKLAFEPGLTGAQARAIQALPYQPISIAFLTAKSPFWQNDGLAPSMWTDGELGGVVAQYFGPSPDNVSGLSVYARGDLAKPGTAWESRRHWIWWCGRSRLSAPRCEFQRIAARHSDLIAATIPI
jgi:monoamine oxidase